jgi:hypothetical protein
VASSRGGSETCPYVSVFASAAKAAWIPRWLWPAEAVAGRKSVVFPTQSEAVIYQDSASRSKKNRPRSAFRAQNPKLAAIR